MANNIDLIYAKSVEEQLARITPQLQAHHKLIVEMAKNNIKFADAPKLAQTPNELKKVADETAKIAKENEKRILAERRLQTAIEKRFDAFEKAQAREQARLNAANSLYNQTQQKLNALTREYDDLAVKKQLYNNLTAAEEKQLQSLTADVQKYDAVLKAVDATKGKYTRNVGNYASGFNALGNSINQLTREAPAFANSVQTGFMALSNNIPIFFDAMQQIINQNKELQAQGKPTQSVIKQIAGAFFSFGSALSVGVTLLTIFGPKLWDSITGSKAKKEALDRQKKAQDELNQAEKMAYDLMVKNAADEIAKSKLLFQAAADVNLKMNQRLDAVNKLRETYPKYLQNLSDEEILSGKTAASQQLLNDALMERAMFLATQDKIIEVTRKIVDLEFKQIEASGALNKKQNLYNITQEGGVKTKNKYRLVTEAETKSTAFLQNQVDELNKSQKGNKTTVKNLSQVYTEQELAYKKQLDVLMSLIKGFYGESDVLDKTIDKKKKLTETRREDIKAMSDELKMAEITGFAVQKYLETQIKIQQGLLEVTSVPTERQAIIKNIEFLKEALKSIDEKPILKVEEAALKVTEAFQKLNFAAGEVPKNYNDFFDSFRRQLEGQSSFPYLLSILKGEIKGFGEDFAVTALAISEAGQEMYNVLSQNSDAYFNRQLANLEQEKETAIGFAGENADARENIEQQYERRRREIQRRQAKAKQKEALFNIGVDTAQAIVSTFARYGFTPQGISAAALMAVIGGLQAAVVSSRAIPEFFAGLDAGAHKGGILQMNEREQERLILPSGRVISPFGENQIVNAPQGTYVATQSQWNDIARGANYRENSTYNGLDAETYFEGIDRLSRKVGLNLQLTNDERGLSIGTKKRIERANAMQNRAFQQKEIRKR